MHYLTEDLLKANTKFIIDSIAQLSLVSISNSSKNDKVLCYFVTNGYFECDDKSLLARVLSIFDSDGVLKYTKGTTETSVAVDVIIRPDKTITYRCHVFFDRFSCILDYLDVLEVPLVLEKDDLRKSIFLKVLPRSIQLSLSNLKFPRYSSVRDWLYDAFVVQMRILASMSNLPLDSELINELGTYDILVNAPYICGDILLKSNDYMFSVMIPDVPLSSNDYYTVYDSVKNSDVKIYGFSSKKILGSK